MHQFLSSNGPFAPRSALEHPTVSRVFAKMCVPRDPFTKFSQNAPAKRFVHKRRKLTPQDSQQDVSKTSNTKSPKEKRLDSAQKTNSSKDTSNKQSATKNSISKDNEGPQVPGAKLFLFRDRPEIMEATKLITETNYRMGRQLNRLCEKRKLLEKQYNKLQERARHFAEVEGKALLADKSDRDYFIEKLKKDLENMNNNVYMGTHQTKQYIRLLRRSKRLARAVARNVVEKQEMLSRWTDPQGGHVARARNQVEVENTAWSIETKNLEKTRNEYFETIRSHASKLSELRQNTTDQKLAIKLEEKAVSRREEIRKAALLEMAHNENKRLVSKALSVTSKQRMTKRTYYKLLTTLAKFQRLMQRLETSTGVVGIDAVVKRWFERDEREKSLRADQKEYETYITNCNRELQKMQEQLHQYQTFGTDTEYTRRATQAFDKLHASFEIRSKEAKLQLQNSRSAFHTNRLNLGLVAECLRSLCVRFELDAPAKALSKQLDHILGYANHSENMMLAKKLGLCISALDRRICNIGRSILTGKYEDHSESFVAAESKAKAKEANRIRDRDDKVVNADNRQPVKSSVKPPTKEEEINSSNRLNRQQQQQQLLSQKKNTEELHRDDELIYGLKKKSISTMNKLKQERSKQQQPPNDKSQEYTVKQLPSSGSALSLLDLPCPLGNNVRVPTRKRAAVGDQITKKGTGPMQRITQQLLDQVHYNGIQWAQVFQAIDMDGSGQIRRSEFSQVLRDLGIKVAQSDLELLMERFDNNRDDKLDYEEFLLMVGERHVDDNSDSSEDDDIVDPSDSSNITNKADTLESESQINVAKIKKSENNLSDMKRENAVGATATVATSSNEVIDTTDAIKTKKSKQTIVRGSPHKSASRNMKQNLRISNNELKKKRKDQEKLLKKNRKEAVLRNNIAQARASVLRGNGKVAPPPGIFSRSQLKEWVWEIERAGKRREEKARFGYTKNKRRQPTLLERAKLDVQEKATMKALLAKKREDEEQSDKEEEEEEEEEQIVQIVKLSK
jgi:hypothetical protein